MRLFNLSHIHPLPPYRAPHRTIVRLLKPCQDVKHKEVTVWCDSNRNKSDVMIISWNLDTRVINNSFSANIIIL